MKSGTIKAAGTKQGLPAAAFAIVGDPEDPGTWALPHHRRSIRRNMAGELDAERTVDWERAAAAVAALSPAGRRGDEFPEPEDVIGAARHLAAHYVRAGRPLPDVLAALV